MFVHCGSEMNLRNDPHTCRTISTIVDMCNWKFFRCHQPSSSPEPRISWLRMTPSVMGEREELWRQDCVINGSRTVYMLFTHAFFRNQSFKVQRHFEVTLSCMWYIQFFIAEGSNSILQNLANFLFNYRATTNSSTGQTWAELFLSPNRG